VTRFQPGDRVFGWCERAYAELVTVDQKSLEHCPDSISLPEAAALPVAGFTALQAVRDKGGVKPGDRVLINGASGGVGTLAVQIAKAFGADVTGVCSVENADLVKRLGADAVIDYRTEDFAERKRAWDVIVDLVGNRPLSTLRASLTRRGTLVLVGGSGGRWFKGTHRFLGATIISGFTRQRLRPLIHEDRTSDLVALKEMVDAGLVSPVVSARYPLSRAAAAIRRCRNGHGRGKILLTVRHRRPRRPSALGAWRVNGAN
jgi:NADPH:quinone reductase-like Zn-dependent oxidoreductase